MSTHRCPHDRLDEDGVCRACSADCRGTPEMPDNKPSAPQFTPGPWDKEQCAMNAISITYNHGAMEVANIECAGMPSREGWANAHLIAAAPDMYAALETSQHVLEIMLNFGEKVEEEALKGIEGCLWPVEEMREQIATIKAALAAARGEK
jgi:hypothetical protein